jgi:hypothetical protein
MDHEKKDDTKAPMKMSSSLSPPTIKKSVSFVDDPFPIPIPPEWPKTEDINTPFVTYIAGYKRTGKDTLATGLKTGCHQHQWIVYAKTEKQVCFGGRVMEHNDVFSKLIGAKNTAFADELKRIVSKGLGLAPNYDYDANKDTTFINGKLVRQYLIDVGTKGRSIDTEIWVKLAVAPLLSNKYPILCTDWRFPEEYKAIEKHNIIPLTIRVFRSSVPIPPQTAPAEHNIDHISTDYLVVSTQQCFDKACEIWKWYKTYVPIGILCGTGFRQNIFS